MFHDVDLINFTDNDMADDLCVLEIVEEHSKFDDESSSTISSTSSCSGDKSECGKLKKQTVKYPKDQKKCTSQIHELVMGIINGAIGTALADTIEILKENYIGTLQRCLRLLFKAIGRIKFIRTE